MRPPRATYRLQLRDGMTLRRACGLARYLERLGVSHLYLSPVLRARRGSPHGYDVTDPTRVDPALGGERELERLAGALRRRELSLVLDIVPNHMAADPEGPAFDDLLRHGRDSRFAAWFDVDWDAGGGRLLLPVLGDAPRRCLDRGELELVRGRGELRVRFFERSYPLRRETLPPPLVAALRAPRGDADAALRSFARGADGRLRLARLLSRQAYRLAHWRSAARRLNYRRFFDVNELVALRADDPAVFDATHAALLGFVRRGWLGGLRVDHVDGIADPRRYLERLRASLRAARPGHPELPVWVEKILEPDEALPRAWPAAGTTGYEFLDRVDAVFREPRGAALLEERWRRRTRFRAGFEEVARTAKREVLGTLLAADLRRLARAALAWLRAASRAGRLDETDLRAAIREVIAQLGIYRVYPDSRRPSADSRRRLEAALAAARTTGRAPRAALDGIAELLLGPASRPGALALQQRFAQLSAPAAAKGVEDTAFYRYTPLLSRNEVGGSPGHPTRGAPARLHRAQAERARRWPRGLLAVTTHDTKRSADVRARLDVLTELPDAWEAAVSRWHRWHAPLRHRRGGRRLPDLRTEEVLYQTLVGVWPLRAPGAAGPDARTLRSLRGRVAEAMRKASREAKQHTSWTRPNAAFESALDDFQDALLVRPGPVGRRFRADLEAFVGEVATPGLWNSLSRTLVQLASPGVPDLYQGDELWNFALVDPDNRRPVDFARLSRALGRVEGGVGAEPRRRAAFVRRLAERPENGLVKLHVVRAGLHARRRWPELFVGGGVEPLRARGPRAAHVFAFARRAGRRVALVAATRLPRSLTRDARRAPLGPEVWGDTLLALPSGLRDGRVRSLLTGSPISPGAGREVAVAEIFAELPVALWVS